MQVDKAQRFTSNLSQTNFCIDRLQNSQILFDQNRISKHHHIVKLAELSETHKNHRRKSYVNYGVTQQALRTMESIREKLEESNRPSSTILPMMSRTNGRDVL